MTVGIMQPYFLPHLGYFDLINYSDRWVVFDTAQYIRHGWQNRNRILHPNTGWQYIVVPLTKHRRDTPVKEILVVEDSAWRERIVNQIAHYKRRAPYFKEAEELLKECLALPARSLATLNAQSMALVCRYLGISLTMEYYSEMELAVPGDMGPGDWAFEISRQMGATEYVNPPGGEPLFDRARFDAAGIKLTIRGIPPMQYSCRGWEFHPSLSIIDVLMWNSPKEIKEYLDDRCHNN